ncbi:uncharacterized protein LAJ45_06516 [Morchella importuna]|uniref:uncharacterized protein n=1 Tax=Morchella importuna TaxID=1174673 RepID=UPI001E8CB4DB|nr:uncharacterized protein LAJ45_06516 [Morchella importuna]KAH8149437.1 hypothetical protein LAJ45_06516 [Morchella importuna]
MMLHVHATLPPLYWHLLLPHPLPPRSTCQISESQRRQVTAARLPPHTQNSIANKPQLKRQEASQQLPDRSIDKASDTNIRRLEIRAQLQLW